MCPCHSPMYSLQVFTNMIIFTCFHIKGYGCNQDCINEITCRSENWKLGGNFGHMPELIKLEANAIFRLDESKVLGTYIVKDQG